MLFRVKEEYGDYVVNVYSVNKPFPTSDLTLFLVYFDRTYTGEEGWKWVDGDHWIPIDK